MPITLRQYRSRRPSPLKRATNPQSINLWGAITGYYSDASNVNHGFLRQLDGTLTTFDPPGSKGTFASSINLWGTITGYCSDASNAFHGFLRAPKRNHHQVRCSGRGHRQRPGHHPNKQQSSGMDHGYYIDVSGVHHGFLLSH
jgi:hypothetical protein